VISFAAWRNDELRVQRQSFELSPFARRLRSFGSPLREHFQRRKHTADAVRLPLELLAKPSLALASAVLP
jgi:hypothetical protein